MKIFKWFRKLKQLIDNYDNILRIANEALKSSLISEALIRDRTDVSVDVGVRGPSTIIMTGVYKKTDYVEIFDMANSDFSHIVDTLKDMKRRHQVRVIDAPASCKYYMRSQNYEIL